MKIKKTTVRKNEQLFEKMDVLTHFFENHEREFHLREIARLIGLAPSTVSKYLNSLVNEKILITRTIKGFRLFRSNTENYLYKDAKLFYNIIKIRNSGLIDFLVEELNYPKSIILFGSFRKGENVQKSDIDIFVETPVKKNLDLSLFEDRLKHPIQLFQFSSKEIEKMKESNKELLNNIANGILLYGFFEVFK